MSVQVRNDLPSSDSWRTVGSGNLYSFANNLVGLTIAYPMTKASHYRIVIDNQDNPPLVLDPKVTFNSPVAVLTFVPRSSGPFYLYFGGNLSAPVYDIDSVLQNSSLKEKDISTVIVSGVLSNPEYKPFVAVVPFSEKYSWLLNTVLVFLIIFIAFLIFGYVRKVMRAGQLG